MAEKTVPVKATAEAKTRLRNFCFTFFGYTDEDLQYLRDLQTSGKVQFIGWGVEVCPTTGNVHLQGYCELGYQLRFNSLKALLPKKMSFHPRNGNQMQAMLYTHEEGKFEEHGVLDKQGMRNDLKGVHDLLKKKRPMTEIIDTYPASFFRYHNGIEKAQRYMVPPREWPTEVYVYWGKTGAGKSRSAREAAGSDAWIRTTKHKDWFDGYVGQENVVFEEFRGNIEFGYLLELTDRYSMQVPVKGGFVNWCPKKMWITSSKHPRDWYHNIEDKEQLYRRITLIQEF